MKNLLRLEIGFVLLTLIAAAAAPDGKNIVEHGTANGAPACSSCHGANLAGNSAIAAPALAGLPAATVLTRLAHYAGPDGHNALMKQVALSLSPAQRAAVAAYIAMVPKSNAHAGG